MTTDLINFKPRQVSIYRQMTEMAAFLARAYQKEVDQTFLDEVAHTAPRIVRWAQALRRADLQEGAGLLQQVSEQASRAPDREADLEWLAVEYAGLFLGASENSVDAIESVYLGEEH